MGNQAYEILGIVQARLEELTVDDVDQLIKQKYKKKIDTFIEEIHDVLNSKLTATEKLERIDFRIQDFLRVACAFSKIQKAEDRKKQEDIRNISIEDEVMRLKQTLAKTLKFSEQISSTTQSQDSTENLKGQTVQKTRTSNAYQVLGLSEKEELSDQKVAIKALTFLKMGISKKAPFNVGEAERMLLRALKYVWAYSKLDTPEKRKGYAAIIQNLQLISNEKVKKAMNEAKSEKIDPEEIENPQTVTISLDEKGEVVLEVSEEYKIITSNFTGDTTSINKYAVKRNAKGKVNSAYVYSIIDMERLQSDPEYLEKVNELLDESRVKASNRYLGGYVGQVIDEQDGLNIRHLPKHIAMCIENRKREQSQENNTPKNSHDEQDEQEID